MEEIDKALELLRNVKGRANGVPYERFISSIWQIDIKSLDLEKRKLCLAKMRRLLSKLRHLDHPYWARWEVILEPTTLEEAETFERMYAGFRSGCAKSELLLKKTIKKLKLQVSSSEVKLHMMTRITDYMEREKKA